MHRIRVTSIHLYWTIVRPARAALKTAGFTPSGVSRSRRNTGTIVFFRYRHEVVAPGARINLRNQLDSAEPGRGGAGAMEATAPAAHR